MDTFWIAYGALLGTIGTLLSVKVYFDRRRDLKPNIKVLLLHGIVVRHPPQPQRARVQTYELVAQNHGQVPVSLTDARFVWNKKDMVFKPEDLLFTAHEAGNACEGQLLRSYLWSALRKQGVTGSAKVRACFLDAVGNRYLSKPLKVHVEAR